MNNSQGINRQKKLGHKSRVLQRSFTASLQPVSNNTYNITKNSIFSSSRIRRKELRRRPSFLVAKEVFSSGIQRVESNRKNCQLPCHQKVISKCTFGVCKQEVHVPCLFDPIPKTCAHKKVHYIFLMLFTTDDAFKIVH